MSYVKRFRPKNFSLILMIIFSLMHCSNLLPDDDDLRSKNSSGILAVGQTAPEFALPTSDGGTLTLASSLAGKNGVVIYFTMWCPVCTSHTDEVVQAIMPSFPNSRYVLVDYVSSSIAEAAMLKNYGGYDPTGIVVALDKAQTFMNSYGATMAYVVIIDSAGKIRMNEVYKRQKMEQILGAL